MDIILPAKVRDLRLDLFRGFANWAIFIVHTPLDAVSWMLIGIGRYGFSDAADWFVFISGYTVAFVYARMLVERGAVIASTRIIRRAWQIYVAHVFLLMVYLVEIGYFGQKFGDIQVVRAFNVEIFLQHPADVLFHGLTLTFKPVNMDVLPLYIVLMLASPFMLLGLVRSRHLTLLASIVLWLAARHFGWNFPSYPGGGWYFNPFAWQLLFVSGAWFAVGGAADTMAFIRSRAFLILGAAYLLFALVMTMAGRYPEFGEMFPSWLVGMFTPNDKTNLAPYRYLHFVVFAVFVVRFLPRDWPGLQWRIFRPIILCGQQSLETFCAGIFLSFAAHFVMVEVSDAVWMQIILAVVGVAIMTVIAWYRHWSKMVDKPSKPASPPSPIEQAVAPARP